MRGLSLAWGILLFPALAAAGEWPEWRGDGRDGAADSSPPLIESIPDEGMRPVWTSETIPSGNQGGWGSPVVAGGRVYVFAHTNTAVGDEEIPPKKFPWLAPENRIGMSDEQYQEYEKNRRLEDFERGKLYNFREIMLCIDAATGQTVWKNDHASVYTRFMQSGTPAVVDGRIYVLGAGRFARCIDAATGEDIWTTRLPGEFYDEFMMSSFAVVGDVAVVLCGHLMALDKTTGELRWEANPNSTKGIHSSPVVWTSPAGKTMLLVNVTGAQTVAVDAASGNEVWRAKTEAGLSTPVVTGNLMVTLGTSRGAGLRCYELTDSGAMEKWVFRGVADPGASPVIVGDYVYAQGERRMCCVDLNTGKAEWSALLDLANPRYTSLIAADGKVIYAFDGVLSFAASPEGFEPLVAAKIDGAGLMATEESFRRMLDLDAIERKPNGLEEAMKLYDQKVGKQGPLQCASPAVVDGLLFVRLRDRLACYDWRAKPAAAAPPAGGN